MAIVDTQADHLRKQIFALQSEVDYRRSDITHHGCAHNAGEELDNQLAQQEAVDQKERELLLIKQRLSDLDQEW